MGEYIRGGATRAPAAVANVAALTSTAQKAGYVYYQNIAAAAATGAADQYDLTGGDGSMANIVQPDVPRNIKITVTDGDAGIDAFTITVTGTAPDGTEVTEVFTFAGGLVQEGSVVFAKVTSIVLTGLNGAGAGDLLDAGYQNKIGVPVPHGSTGLGIVKLVSNAVEEAASATDTTENSFTPTTSPNGTNDYEVWYEYLDAGTAAVIVDIAAVRTTLNALLAQLRATYPSAVLPSS